MIYLKNLLTNKISFVKRIIGPSGIYQIDGIKGMTAPNFIGKSFTF
jgi:hypothetical protein